MTTSKYIVAFTFLLGLVLAAQSQNGPSADEHMRLAESLNKELKRDEAITYYEKAAVEFHKLGNIEQFVNANNQIGIILTRQDKYERARSYLDKALSTGLSKLDANDPVIATTYLCLGVVAAAEDQFDRSLAYHDKALKIRLLKLGKYNAQTAASYGNIGNVYFRKREYGRAVEAHEKARQIRERVFGKDSVEIVESYRNLGNAYREKKDYKRSLGYFERSLSIKTKQLGEGHADLVRYYRSISDVYELMGNKTKAAEYKTKADQIEKPAK